jgi:hypothetical protein
MSAGRPTRATAFQAFVEGTGRLIRLSKKMAVNSMKANVRGYNNFTDALYTSSRGTCWNNPAVTPRDVEYMNRIMPTETERKQVRKRTSLFARKCSR